MPERTCVQCDQPVEWEVDGGLCDDHWQALCGALWWQAVTLPAIGETL